MNFVAISPHFPPNYLPFWAQLRRQGVNVLGLADTRWDDLPGELKSILTEYYYVWNGQDYDAMLRALGYFTHRYGKIDRLESHNEFWLESDARLRTDFNIPGLHTGEVAHIKRKSEMKKMFKKAGLPFIPGRVCLTRDEAEAAAEEFGYPLVAKPDIGVGAYGTFKVHDATELARLYESKPLEDYILEQFIEGDIVTYDGLTDQSGNVVFDSSMRYSGIMDTVNLGLETWYYILRAIPPDLLAAGRQIVKAYRLSERFFHLEFFRTPDGGLVPLEVNMRPPGGMTTDMWNYANDIDIFREYANVVVSNRFEAKITRPYFCAYAGRRYQSPYCHSHQEILDAFPHEVAYSGPINGVFSAAIGDFGYVIRSPDEETIQAIIRFIHDRD